MNLLLDTCIFLWYISGDKKLKLKYRELIQDLDNETYLSVVSIWEATIKQMNNKLVLPEFAGEYLSKAVKTQ